MKYIDYVSLPWHKKTAYRISQGIKNLPSSVRSVFSKAGKVLYAFVRGLWSGILQFLRIFSKGDLRTKLSYLLMGSGCLLRGQIVKGLGFLAIQFFYIVYMVSFGWDQLKLFPSLGEATKKQVWDEANQIYRYVQGDNSMLILLFSVLTLFVTASFVVFYGMNVRTAYANQQKAGAGIKLPSFRQELKDLFDRNLHITFLSLPMLGVLAFTILPLLFMILIAFTNYDANHQPPGSLFTWVGFDNFRDIFKANPVLSSSFSGILGWTLIWAFFATFTNYILGMIVALMINKKGIRFKKFWRTIFVTTIAVPQFVTLLLMSRLLADQGAANVLLKTLGMSPIPFLTDVMTARITVIVVNIWVGIPYTMLITTGILMNIPAELYESARIDGASAYKTFTKITLPYMLFITTPYLITSFINNINNFNVIYLLTGGGPLSLDYYQAGKTDLLVTWLYKLTVNQQDYNLASSIGIIIFLLSAVISLVLYNASSSVKKEDSFR